MRVDRGREYYDPVNIWLTPPELEALYEELKSFGYCSKTAGDVGSDEDYLDTNESTQIYFELLDEDEDLEDLEDLDDFWSDDSISDNAREVANASAT